MMNTHALAHMPAGSSATTDGLRSAGKQGDGGGEGGSFKDLLAKLSLAGADATDAPSPTAGEQTEGELLKAGSEHAGTSSGSLGDLAALVLALSSGASAAGGSDLAAALNRMAAGSATDADDALIQSAMAEQQSKASSPEGAILTALAKLANRDAAVAATDDDATAALLTVLRRETHLPPSQMMAGGGVHSQLAAEVAAQARHAAQGAGAREEVASAAAANGDQPDSLSQILALRSAVVAAQGSQLGTSGDRDGSPPRDLQAGAEALTASAATSASAQADGFGDIYGGNGVVHQIAQRVVSEVSTQAATTTTGGPGALTFMRHDAPMKVLHIQLQPGDLGAVTIRMSVKDNALRLDLEVGRGDTAQLIQRDREALSAMLRSAGYLIEGVEIRIADASGNSGQIASSQTQSQGGHAGSDQPDARSPGERGSQDRSRNPFGNGSNGEEEQAGRAAPRGGVYV